MLKRKRKLIAMFLVLAVLLGGLQQTAVSGVKAQAAVKTQTAVNNKVTVRTQTADGKNTVKKSNKVKAKLKGDSISEAADVTTGSAIYDDTLPTMDVSIKQGGSKQIKLKWNSYEGAAYYTVFYQYILPLYAVTWVAFSFTELIVSISSLPVLPSNRRVNRMGWSKGGFIRTALLST